jgi:hypothetical protein
MDVDARMQLFDFKTKYQFQTQPGVDQYNMPLYDVQSETPGNPNSQDIGMFPVYQGFMEPAYINGVQVGFHTQKNYFFNWFQNIVQPLNVVAIGDGTIGPYPITFPIINTNSTPLNPPVQALLRGHVDITGIIATGVNDDPPFGTTINPLIPSTSIIPAVYFTSIDANGNNIIVSDSGQFLQTAGPTNNATYGLLMSPGKAPFGNMPLAGGYSTTSNTINYLTGTANVTFPTPVPAGANINAQCYYFNTGLPRGILYYNNVLTLRVPPSQQWLVELDAYLTPAAFFNTAAAVPFGYMSEYIARGAARKILSDTGDVEQFNFYKPLFREQELLVWKRSQRQWTSTRTQTIYSQGMISGYNSFNSSGLGLI